MRQMYRRFGRVFDFFSDNLVFQLSVVHKYFIYIDNVYRLADSIFEMEIVHKSSTIYNGLIMWVWYIGNFQRNRLLHIFVYIMEKKNIAYINTKKIRQDFCSRLTFFVREPTYTKSRFDESQ